MVAAVILASVGTVEELLIAEVSFVNEMEVTTTFPSERYGIQDDSLCTERLSVVRAELVLLEFGIMVMFVDPHPQFT